MGNGSGGTAGQYGRDSGAHGGTSGATAASASGAGGATGSAGQKWGCEPRGQYLPCTCPEGSTTGKALCDANGHIQACQSCPEVDSGNTRDLLPPVCKELDGFPCHTHSTVISPDSCEFTVPGTPESINPSVNVQYTLFKPDAYPICIVYDNTEECDNGANGWQYARKADGTDNLGAIVLCGDACATVKNNLGVQVDVLSDCYGIP
jgi:hypothetical protein